MLKTSILSVTSAAADRTLLTIDQLRSAAWVTGSSYDPDLTILGNRIAATITRFCGVASAGITPPTLRKERLSETFRRHPSFWGYDAQTVERDGAIVLSRHPLVSVVSVIGDSVALVENTDFESDPATAMLYRLSDDTRTPWWESKVVIVYDAGWDAVPDDLAFAAARLAGLYWKDAQRDLNVRQDWIQDIGRTEYFANQLATTSVPPDVAEMLQPYINRWIV